MSSAFALATGADVTSENVKAKTTSVLNRLAFLIGRRGIFLPVTPGLD